MSFIGNIIWMIFGGFISGIGYIVGGLLICLTIVGIPVGVQAIKLGFGTMVPFGKEIIATEEAAAPGKVILNLVWAVLFGWEVALSHLLHGVLLYITIIGIPFAKQHFKLIPLSLAPFGRELR